MEFERDPTTQDLERHPLQKLTLLVDKYHIPVDNNMGKWVMNKKYAYYDSKDDFDKIYIAIKNIVESDRVNEVPPPIIAIRKTVHAAPVVFFIRTTIPIYRKKKSIKSKSKRKVKCKCN